MALAEAPRNVGGRPSNRQLADRLERAREVNTLLRAENRALTDEREAVATEMAGLSRRIDLAIRADRPDVAMHVAGRLDDLAASLHRRGAV